MDFLVRERCKSWKTEALGKCVDSRMSKESDAVVVRLWYCRIVLHRLATQRRKVVIFIEVLEYGGNCGEVIVGKIDAPAGIGGCEALACAR